jgi:2-polyprenyl-6-methoxyphenol hydroxylase-like FAD-dependent oxidoreductase
MTTALTTQCCIAGGGPAGLMLAVLLARAGVDVVVVEKHPDFLRDFRGDTIHPSTMELMHELGWLDDFLKLPHERVTRLVARFGDELIALADLSGLPVQAPYIAMMPQWDFLNFLAERGRRYQAFKLRMQTTAETLIETDGMVTGIRATTPAGTLEIHADLVVAADGRQSTLRSASGLAGEDFGAPMDVLWFRLPREPDDPLSTGATFAAGRIFITLNRGDYWQCAFVIPKGQDAAIRGRGLDQFRRDVADLTRLPAARMSAISTWSEVKLLTVQVDRLTRWWKPGFLCIGDAAHAMSPIGGVGVNLAVQDAVAAANVLAEPLREGRMHDQQLAAVQKRREWPTHATQQMQLMMQRRVIAPILALAKDGEQPVAGPAHFQPPMALRWLPKIPLLRQLPGRLVGLGLRREHIRTAEWL